MDLTPRPQASTSTLKGYIPVAVKWINTQAQIDWAFVSDTQFTASFFDETIQQCMQRPLNLAFRPTTNIEALHACVRNHECLSPSAFVFHLSRCGSTLLAQMFAAVPQNFVLSEASPIDRILAAKRFNPNLSDQDHIAMLRAVVLSLGQKRRPELNRYIIKLDSWHISYVDLIQRAFPNVPWVFLYREPLEVLVSNLDQMAGRAMPGSPEHLPPNVALMDALTMPIEQYMSLVLADIFREALAHQKSQLGLFVNYQDLPLVALPKILEHFGIDGSEQELAQMQQKTKFHAKQPGETFSPDSARKQREASVAARHFSDLMLTPLYQQLEAIRWRP